MDSPPLQGRRFNLVPVVPAFYRPLYELAINSETCHRWRFQGAIPTFEMFRESVLTNVLSQFMAVHRSNPRRVVGYVFAYNAHHADGHACFAAVNDPGVGAGAFEYIALFVRHLFAQWPFRKLYIEAAAFNVEQYQSAVSLGLLKEERRLIENRYFDGQYWDEVTYALYREDAVAFAIDRPLMFPDKWGQDPPSNGH